jgi:hypothetical protein
VATLQLPMVDLLALAQHFGLAKIEGRTWRRLRLQRQPVLVDGRETAGGALESMVERAQRSRCTVRASGCSGRPWAGDRGPSDAIRRVLRRQG